MLSQIFGCEFDQLDMLLETDDRKWEGKEEYYSWNSSWESESIFLMKMVR